MFFYSGYSMHGCYWHNNFGQPMSHGCVNMRMSDAQWLYNWAPVGTLVIVR
jgi:lipoprotein-anchoring transpeptidase ErfK/SrfK